MDYLCENYENVLDTSLKFIFNKVSCANSLFGFRSAD